MSVLDRLREKAKQFAGKNPEKMQRGIDRAAQKADEKTGGKYSEQINRGAAKAKEGEQGRQQGGEQPPGRQQEGRQDRPPEGS
ncbi:MAG: antitoxin [Streptosporangiales bacterium]|nr:antitoxin [Streptosporangiales bacterium]